MSRYLGNNNIEFQERMPPDQTIRRQIHAAKNNTGFKNIVSLGIIVDADTNARGKIQSIRDALRNEGLPVPTNHMLLSTSGLPTTIFLVLPDGIINGQLETNILDSLSANPVLPCVNQYINCIPNGIRNIIPDLEKSKVQAYLASCNNFCHYLGDAATAGIWQFGNPAFEIISRFLSLL